MLIHAVVVEKSPKDAPCHTDFCVKNVPFVCYFNFGVGGDGPAKTSAQKFTKPVATSDPTTTMENMGNVSVLYALVCPRHGPDHVFHDSHWPPNHQNRQDTRTYVVDLGWCWYFRSWPACETKFALRDFRRHRPKSRKAIFVSHSTQNKLGPAPLLFSVIDIFYLCFAISFRTV